ncbi:MAG: aminopeptidase P N-terminal domain-containing protein [Candidatus Aminicenantes bacterium]|nr:aminopeptidase P N-terminal domain-containing protein [Candidatus Aminicenantes bacterium]
MHKKLAVCLLVLALGGPSVAAGVLPFEVSEYAGRRARFMAQIPDGIAVIWGSLAVPQNNDFLYLCGVKVPRAALIVDGVRKESLLFYTTTETYLKGEGMSPDLARDPKGATGVERAYPAEQLTAVLNRLGAQARVIYTPFRAENAASESASSGEWDGRLTRELQFVKLLRERFPQAEVRDCNEKLWDLRRIKTPAEIEVQRRSGRIGVQAMTEVLKAARPGQMEYELSALFEYVCKREGCPEQAFNVIISSAENHPYLHYAAHNRKLVDGDFVVFDAGPEFGDYDIDITISFPVNGVFSPRQRQIYQACLEVSQACLSLYRPGLSGYDIGEKAKEIIRGKGLDPTAGAFPQLRFFKEGGLTHYVGLATHDAGGADLNYGAPLKPGQVFASDLFAVWPGENLGVRVENTVLVTDTGCENLSAGIPRQIAEIEDLMRKSAAARTAKK